MLVEFYRKLLQIWQSYNAPSVALGCCKMATLDRFPKFRRKRKNQQKDTYCFLTQTKKHYARVYNYKIQIKWYFILRDSVCAISTDS